MFLLLLAPALFAQEPLPTRQIEAALEDELYPLAEQQIWEALSTKRTPDEEAMLTILLVRRGFWSEVRILIQVPRLPMAHLR